MIQRLKFLNKIILRREDLSNRRPILMLIKRERKKFIKISDYYPKAVVLILSLVFLTSIFTAINLQNGIGVENSNPKNEAIPSTFDRGNSNNFKISALTSISITSNYAFQSLSLVNSWPGDGTAGNPYIISDYVFNGTGSGSGISIQNTDVYFKITNTSVSNFLYAFYFNNVTNGIIDNSSATFGANCIYIANSKNVIINNTVSYNNTAVAINIGNSNNITASNNVGYYSNYAIYLSSTNNSHVTNNIGYNTQAGVFLGNNDNNNIITSNKAYNNQFYGIYLYGSANNTIDSNEAYNNGNYGIQLYNCGNNNKILSNNIHDNGQNGIDITNSNHTTITGNSIKFHPQYGLRIGSSTNSLVDNNDFYNDTNAVYIYQSMYSYVSSNTVYNNSNGGIDVSLSNESTIIYNVVFNNNFGIITDSNNTLIEFNTVYNSKFYGFEILFAFNDSINSNTVYNCNTGFYLQSSAYNRFNNNIGHDNSQYGFAFYSSSNNTLTSNALYNNLNQDVYIDANSFGNVISNPVPAFSSTPNDLSYLAGSSITFNLTWNMVDDNPDNYTIYQNGTIVNSGLWYSNTPLTLDVSSLPIGVYNYTIVIMDFTNQTASNTVFVTVSNVLTPVFVSTPSDFSFNIGDTTQFVSWSLSDDNPNTFLIFVNGNLIQTGSWSSNAPVSYNLDVITTPGTYNITAVFTDYSNLNVSNTVFVTAVLNQVPQFTEVSGDITITEGGAIGLVWIALDDNPSNYSIFQNNIDIAYGDWSSGSPITQSFSGLSIGSYVITIFVRDFSNNQNKTSMTITVVSNSHSGSSSPSNPSSSSTTSQPSVRSTVSITPFNISPIEMFALLSSLALIHRKRKKNE